ncbi:MAG: hypothetical protein FVQ82_05295 [Planctomycetes bacterium]|nr:hypothetical protein [Planctomycetota bacterium]
MVSSSWKIDNKKSSSEKFFKVKPDCKLRIRLIDDPVRLVKIFSHDRKCAVIESEEVGKRLREQYPTKLSSVNIRFACWCIDRDDNSLKILDMPVSVARTLGNREALVGEKIAGIAEGCDWSITTNGKQGMEVRYDVVYLEETPLSCLEREMVEDKKSEKNGHYDLTKIFGSCDFEEAEEKLFGI